MTESSTKPATADIARPGAIGSIENPTAESPATDAWYYAESGRQAGPVPVAILRQMLAGGRLPYNAPVWREPMADWTGADAVAELRTPTSPGGGPPPLPSMASYSIPVPEDLGQNAGMRVLLPVGRSAWAIAAGYLGLFALIPLFGLPLAVCAVVFGVLAQHEMRRNPSKHGMGRAVFGLVVGSVMTLVDLGLIALAIVYRSRL